jgi:hypothetical protein
VTGWRAVLMLRRIADDLIAARRLFDASPLTQAKGEASNNEDRWYHGREAGVEGRKIEEGRV